MMEVKLTSFEKNLEAVIGKKVSAITGYVSSAFGEDTPVFKLCRIVFDDGTSVHVEGEHDMPYIPSDEVLTEKMLKKHRPEDDADEDDDED